uniref:Origin recognition complex subunit 2 n=1 Tax=Culex pipiens TaxID=7175 RepID=A0A8D8IVH1_CULPI
MSRRKSTAVRRASRSDDDEEQDADGPVIEIDESSASEDVSSASSSHRPSTRKSVSRKTMDAEESSNAEEPAAPNDRRRSTRHRSPNKRYTGDFVQPKLKRGGRKEREDEDEDEEDTGLDSEEQAELDELASKVKATTLFEDRVDVEGQRIYGFKTPRKRDSMNVLVSSVQKTPTASGTPKRAVGGTVSKTPKTPSGRGRSKADLVKTPHRDRNKLKKTISKIVQNASDSDFSASESDFVPSSDGDDDDDEENGDESDESEKESSSDEDAKPKRPVLLKTSRPSIGIAPGKSTPTTPVAPPSTSGRPRRNARKKPDLQYVLQSDEYFSTHSASKVVTSDHTLDRLNTPRLPHDQLFRLLRDLRGSADHERAIHELHEEYEGYFAKWLFLMNEGFNILLYGLGSKRNLLQTFHRKVLANQPVLVINGFFPTLTIKDVLDAIANDILDLNLHSGNHHEVVDAIEEEFRYLPETHLFLIVHNLDGTMLRNGKAQNVLARLAKIENVHLLASIDHINTPLIWDSSKLSYYNFSWWDVTTMLPYTDETAFENSLLVQNSGALALSSMKNVFQSLTTNSRGIFLVIVKHQLANGGRGNPHYPGMLFKDLYWNCREAFLVSSDLALRAQLTEFIDHKLVKVKRTVDGAENLLIPIEHGLLQQFVEENDDGK